MESYLQNFLNFSLKASQPGIDRLFAMKIQTGLVKCDKDTDRISEIAIDWAM